MEDGRTPAAGARGEPDFFAIDMPGEPVAYMAMLLDGTGAVTGLRFQQIVDMYRNPDIPPWT